MRAGKRPVTGLKALALAAALTVISSACGSSTPTPSPQPSTSARPSLPPSASATPPVAGPSAPLRELARGRSFGTAVLTPWIFDQPEYGDGTMAEFGSVTPEKVMTWAAIEPTQGAPDFSNADSVVTWAAYRGLKVRGDGLVWDKGLPAWLTTAPMTQPTEGVTPRPLNHADLAALLQDHIATEVGHFAGQIYAWDVVTDPYNDDGSIRHTIWEVALGPDYIARALEWAHIADPKAKLYINDSAEALGPKSDALYALVQSLLAQGVPIDGIGFEAHLDASGGYPAAVVANLQRFAALGIEVAITELDVKVHVPPLEGEVDRQLTYYVQMVSACFATPGCVGVTVWEWSDRYSWIPGAFPGYGTADLWDANFNPKPVLAAVKAAMQGAP